MKKHHQKQIKKLKRIKRKAVNEKHVKVASLMKFRRRRLRLEHTLGCGGINNNQQHLQDNHGSISKKNSSASPSSILIVTTNNNASSSSRNSLLSKATTLQRRKSRVVRFRDDDITDATIEWKREQQNQNQKYNNNGNNNNNNTINTSKLGLELHREQKKTQRELLDLQVGMKCMGL
jgi:hypothetical protein